LAETAAAAFLIYFFFWKIFAFDPVSRSFFFWKTPDWTIGVSIAAAAFLLFFLPARKGGWKELAECGKNGLPLIPAALLLLIPFTSTPLPLLGAFFLIGWGCCRHCAASGDPLPFEKAVRRLTPRGGLAFSILLALAGCGWGFYMQTAAYHRLFLLYSDWGIYAEHWLKLLSGTGSLHDWLVAGGHWNGAVNLLMTAALRVAPSPETVFLLNSVMIYSAVPLIYLLGRQLKLPASIAAVFSLLFVFTPVVSNQPLSLFYGFHPVNLLPSCFLLFFWFRERRQCAAAIAVMIFTLFVQETAAIFWFGYAIFLAFDRKFRRALILGIAMILIFMVLSRWGIPEGSGNYTQMFHFSQLGNTPLEAALSPVLRPAAFFGTLFAVNNLEFLLFLVLPFLFLIPYAPKLLLAGLPLLAGVCLQSSRGLQNVVLQYGVELNCLVVVTAIFGAARLYAAGNRRWLRAVLAAALFGVAALYLLAGKSVKSGKYAFSMILERPEAETLISFLEAQIPAGTTVYAPQRVRAHLVFRCPTRDLKDPAMPGAVYVLEAREGTEDNQLRQALLEDPAIAPVTAVNWYGDEFVIFRKLAEPAASSSPLPFLRPVTPEEFVAFGSPVESDSGVFRIRARVTSRSVQFMFLPVGKPAGDFRFLILIDRGGLRVPYRLTFAHGLRLASQVPPETAFLAELPLPEGAAGPVSVEVEVTGRSPSHSRP